MQLKFYKYQATGNDFVLIDNRRLLFNKNNTVLIKKLCDRKFGIGADGLILLEDALHADFRMIYYNADGRESSLCGNGGRCVTAFAKFLTIVADTALFEAVDGMHRATVKNGDVELQMADVAIATIKVFDSHVFLDTGSPHHVTLVEDVTHFQVKEKGREIRRGSPYLEKGANVNFVSQLNKDMFKIRTYERGVEDETLSCGTGATAVAIAMNYLGKTTKKQLKIKTLGGDLVITFDKDDSHYRNVCLKGAVERIFEGIIPC